MSSNRRIVFQLLAAGRINPTQAERLLAVSGLEREEAWAIAGCAMVALAAQLHALLPLALRLCSALTASLPALHHVFTSIAVSLGGQP